MWIETTTRNAVNGRAVGKKVNTARPRSVHACHTQFKLHVLITHNNGSCDCGMAKYLYFKTVLAGKHPWNFKGTVGREVERCTEGTGDVDGPGTRGFLACLVDDGNVKRWQAHRGSGSL